jgi:ATP-dependent RNA helicase RhlE
MTQKRVLLVQLLRDPAMERVLVFTRTKHGADRVVRQLLGDGIEAVAIHGNKSQPQRERALAGFRSGHSRVLVATDIAARGIDIDAVSHVINFDLPNVAEDYVHRIGRTARAGAAGIAISLCSDDERPYLRDIEKLTRLRLAVVPLPADLPTPGPAELSERRHEPRQRHHPAAKPARHSAPRPHAGRNVSRDHRQEADAPAGGLPAFLHRDPAGRPSSRGPWRQRGAGRGARAVPR